MYAAQAASPQWSRLHPQLYWNRVGDMLQFVLLMQFSFFLCTIVRWGDPKIFLFSFCSGQRLLACVMAGIVESSSTRNCKIVFLLISF
jgi:hypothetical protein